MVDMVPKNETGMQTNTESSLELNDETQAKEFYEVVQNRLLQVNEWHDLAGKASAKFELSDKNGTPVSRWAQAGDHIRIDIPGPGSATGDGDDWVQIEEIQEENNCVSVRVRPATNPLNEKQDVAHRIHRPKTSKIKYETRSLQQAPSQECPRFNGSRWLMG
jgi:hypothetical protein